MAKCFKNLIKLLIPVQCTINIRMFVIELLNKCILIKFIESIPILYNEIIFNCILLQFEVIEEDKVRYTCMVQ